MSVFPDIAISPAKNRCRGEYRQLTSDAAYLALFHQLK